jgi:7-keto-8-aminopelargonate synthetase-like enzyme
MKEPEPLQQVDRTFVRAHGRKLSYFSGCDYFRLSSHPAVLTALETGARRYGLNVAASRLTTGNHLLYGELEHQIVDFFRAQDTLLTSTGYAANLVAAQALSGGCSHALVDEKAHPSLADAARFLECPVLRFKHRDAEDAARVIHRCGPRSKIILLTDGMFSHDGSCAPLAEYKRALPRDAVMLVDDAHGAGVLGASGKGALEHARVDRRGIIQTITLSKAFGAYGGAVLATPQLRRRILERSQLFIASTPLPLPLAAAALRAVTILRDDRHLRQRLIQNVKYVIRGLDQSGVDFPDTSGPIISIRPAEPQSMATLKQRLLAAGIYPPYLKYPGGPAAGHFRFVISSEHTRAQLDGLLNCFRVVSGFNLQR